MEATLVKLKTDVEQARRERDDAKRQLKKVQTANNSRRTRATLREHKQLKDQIAQLQDELRAALEGKAQAETKAALRLRKIQLQNEKRSKELEEGRRAAQAAETLVEEICRVRDALQDAEAKLDQERARVRELEQALKRSMDNSEPRTPVPFPNAPEKHPATASSTMSNTMTNTMTTHAALDKLRKQREETRKFLQHRALKRSPITPVNNRKRN